MGLIPCLERMSETGTPAPEPEKTPGEQIASPASAVEHPYYGRAARLESIVLVVVLCADFIALSYYPDGSIITNPPLVFAASMLYGLLGILRKPAILRISMPAQMVLAGIGCAFGPARFYQWLFVPLVVRACFLVSRRTALFSALICLVVFTVAYSLTFEQRYASLEGGLAALLFAHLLQLSVLLFSAVVITLSLLAEYQSRMKAEKLAREIEEIARKLERTEIGREIHDSLGHSLTTLNLHLTLAEKVFESDPQKSKAALSLARDFARQSIADVRFALQALRSDKLRMDEAVGRLVEDLEKVHSVKVTAVMTWPALSTEQAHHLYCIIRECLNNTQKYAQAKEISIEASYDSAFLNVLIKDDGQGFDPSLPRDGSYGLMGASERLAQLGGSFSVQSSPGAGTVVSIKLPL